MVRTHLFKTFTFLLLLVVSYTAYAAKKDTFRALKSDIQESRQKIHTSEKKKREVLLKIFHLNQKIKEISDSKGGLNEKMFALKSESKKTAQRINEINQEVKEVSVGLRKKLMVIHKLKDGGRVKALFSSSSPYEIERNIRFLSIVSKKNAQALKEYQNLLVELKKQKNILNEKVKKLLLVKKKIKKSEKSLYAEQRKKSKLIGKIENERQWYIKKIKKIRKKTLNMEISEDKLLSQSLFFERKGQLDWPIKAQVETPYGLYQLGDHGTQIHHKGVVFRRSKVRNAHVVAPGKVAFVGVVEGYQNVIVVDHSDNYYTVYGHLDEVKVQVGERVLQGQRIAFVRPAALENGKSSEKGLYFEIRHYNQAEDPMQWMKPQEIMISAQSLVSEG